jgi:hypothetical protein
VLEKVYERAVAFAEAAKRQLAGFELTPEVDALMALPDYVLSRDC